MFKKMSAMFLVLTFLLSASSGFAQEKKSKKFFRKLGRGAGNVTTYLAKNINRPFIYGTSFLHGFFEKEELREIDRLNKKLEAGEISQEKYDKLIKKYQDRMLVTLLLEFVMQDHIIGSIQNYIDEVNETRNYVSFQQFQDKVMEILSEGVTDLGIQLVTAVLKEMNPKLSLSENGEIQGLQDLSIEEMMALGKMKASDIKKLESFKAIERITGPLEESEIEDMVNGADFSEVVENLVDEKQNDIINAIKIPLIVDLSTGLLAEIITTSAVLSIIPNISFGVASILMTAINAGAGASIGVCLKTKTQEKIGEYLEMRDRASRGELEDGEIELFKNYENLAKFCHNNLHDSLTVLLKSRSKGYLKGKESKIKFNKKMDELKAKLKERKEKRRQRREQRREDRVGGVDLDVALGLN